MDLCSTSICEKNPFLEIEIRNKRQHYDDDMFDIFQSLKVNQMDHGDEKDDDIFAGKVSIELL